ncbi:hypothetical protein Acy02nite_51030 [Actinoplanes cyaneus]|uniref:Double-GTPase 2 domain-containing protein n=1 Tax=Actinoplanes cyaneus TaxID=52696 RepID=A0A919M606_9ACTN|nr:hypothetical protein [Actinoplanes cyaneus]MCW2141159.1 hypothetical protein [Actinoplanes cyaneus]GID67222.1 hypothetical protein Acy02nite_51030 [Actinoplanes cyaneus]
MADAIPAIQVTMLGGTGSGKTTYLVGMYAHLSAGLGNFFLHADNRDVDLDLASAWDAMIEDGLLPQPTTEEGGLQVFDFTFRYGVDPLLRLNWVDYRGGVIRDRDSSKQDVSQLVARLGETDSVYITLDGALLADVLEKKPAAETKLQSAIGRYARTLGEIADQRDTQNLIPPSVVLLITKGDLLRSLLPGDVAQRERQAREWAQKLLPQVFRHDWDVAVCIVSIGRIGRLTSSRVDPGELAPFRIDRPMVFSLYSYYRRAAIAFAAIAGKAEQETADHQRTRDDSRRTLLGRLLNGKQQQQLDARMGDLRRYHDVMEGLAAECRLRCDILADELLDTPMYIEGAWTAVR